MSVPVQTGFTKQALPNSEHAYLSNAYDFTGCERGRYQYKLIFNVSIYVSTVSNGYGRENLVVHNLNKYSMLKPVRIYNQIQLALFVQ
jgi:hypothetical protein